MPWRGAEVPGEFPTLGHIVAEWIENWLIVPDRERRGERLTLTDEQYRHFLNTYRLKPHATAPMGSQAFEYYGSMLVRPQKWGKDPLAAADACAQALADVRFAGWDANGEPVGAPMPTPHVQCAANSEDQVANTYDLIYTMLTEGPAVNIPGLDVGLTRVNLPGGGKIEPVTAAARSRLGQRITYATFTESGLYTETSGGVAMARTMKRGLAGMDGRWTEITNAWDPSERSVAQRTHEAAAPGVYVNYRPPRAHIDTDDDQALYAELVHLYGDSAIENGGWVRIERIMEEIRNPATGDGEARRFYLNEIVVGSRDAVDALKWEVQKKTDEPLEQGDRITLGFFGTQNRDATSLCACRLADGRVYHLRTWDKPENAPDGWKIPRSEVKEAVSDAFEAFDVVSMMCFPHAWQDEVDEWAGQYMNHGDKYEDTSKVLEIWLNSEQRVDQLIERFLVAHRGGEFSHDGNPTLTRHALGAALANGKRRPAGEEREAGQSDNYQRVVKKSWAQSISAYWAALLALEARGWAIEHGHNADDDDGPSIW
jgi:hypothetical protein